MKTKPKKKLTAKMWAVICQHGFVEHVRSLKRNAMALAKTLSTKNNCKYRAIKVKITEV